MPERVLLAVTPGAKSVRSQGQLAAKRWDQEDRPRPSGFPFFRVVFVSLGCVFYNRRGARVAHSTVLFTSLLLVCRSFTSPAFQRSSVHVSKGLDRPAEYTILETSVGEQLVFLRLSPHRDETVCYVG